MDCVLSVEGDEWTIDTLHPKYPRRREFVGYSEPRCRDTVVVVAFFSAAGFETPRRNALRVLRDLRGSGVPTFLVELLYPGQSSAMPRPDMIEFASTPMFHKENLWNLAATAAPDRYSKLVFLDADVRLTIPDWVDRVSELLDSHDVLQPMDVCDWSGHALTKPSTAAAHVAGRSVSPAKSHPGFALGVRRDWLQRFGGFWDKSSFGSGDTVFWATVTGSPQGLGANPSPAAKRAVREGLERRPGARVGYLPGCTAIHMPHGLTLNRQYKDRYATYPTSDSLRLNSRGLWEFSCPADAAQAVRYFISRAEDGGVGSALASIFSRAGVPTLHNCQCAQRAAILDRNGPDWAAENIGLIVQWLREAASRAHWPFSEAATRALVNWAIRKARKIERRRMLRAPKIPT